MVGIDAYALAYTAGYRSPGLTVTPARPRTEQTHEGYLLAIAGIGIARIGDPRIKARLQNTKITYGAGGNGARGSTYFQAWRNGEPESHEFIEICAISEESDVQLAGTMLHELGHVIAGHGAGHDGTWKTACKVLGLVNAEAMGQEYRPDGFAPEVWEKIQALPLPTDGKPVFKTGFGVFLPPGVRLTPRACPLGQGRRGGRSRGAGSGTRNELYECKCDPPVKVRHAGDRFHGTCKDCGKDWEKVEAPTEARSNAEGGVR